MCFSKQSNQNSPNMYVENVTAKVITLWLAGKGQAADSAPGYTLVEQFKLCTVRYGGAMVPVTAVAIPSLRPHDSSSPFEEHHCHYKQQQQQ